jgi:hypothetical protein
MIGVCGAPSPITSGCFLDYTIRCLLLRDAVEKDRDLIVVPLDASFVGLSVAFDSCLGVDADASNVAYAAAAANARVRFGGGLSIRSARVLRFCTMAARWNSSRAPERPRSRIRSKPWWIFRCANLISTRFLSSRDLANPFVFIFHRATSRASSWRSRGILRASALVQHLVLSGAPGLT